MESDISVRLFLASIQVIVGQKILIYLLKAKDVQKNPIYTEPLNSPFYRKEFELFRQFLNHKTYLLTNILFVSLITKNLHCWRTNVH